MNSIDQERNKRAESPDEAARRHEARGYRAGYFDGKPDSEPKFYRALAREYVDHPDRNLEINWRLAIKCFATWLDDRSEQSAVEVKQLRCRAAGWLAAPEGESPAATRELVKALYDRLKDLQQFHDWALPQITDLKRGSIQVKGAVLMSDTVEVGTIVGFVEGLERLLEPESKERVRVLPDGSVEKITWGMVPGGMHEDQCSWGCHYDGDGQLVRNPACTVHGASNR